MVQIKKFIGSSGFLRFIAITCTILIVVGIYGLIKTPVTPEKEFSKTIEIAQAIFALMFLVFVAVMVDKDKRSSQNESKDTLK